LKLRGGNTRIVFYSGSTQINKQTSGTADDLAVGSAIMVTGTANSDGSISALMISSHPVLSVPGSQTGNPPAENSPH